MRRLGLLGLLAVCLAACGGSAAPHVDITRASAVTVASGSLRFTYTITGVVAGVPVESHETGTISFRLPRAHLYKLVQGLSLPEELVLNGPLVYTNANVEAAMNDSSVKPWTKLDLRRLSAKVRRQQPDELAHVRAVAYLADGVAAVSRVGEVTLDGTPTTHVRGRVDPARLARRLPAAQRAAILGAVRRDFLAAPFPADFWIDRSGRVRRVRVDYRTARGSKIGIDVAFSDFGTRVDLTLPPAASIADISP